MNTKKWEITIMELRNGVEKKYEVTRRFPSLAVSETKLFRTREEARKQFDEWLGVTL